MKRTLLVCATVIGLLSVWVIVRWDSFDFATAQRTITAVGSATVYGAPDSARLFLEVVTKGKTLAATREENAGRVNTVREALVALC
jgi:uncharacterized protein YggE